MQRFPLFSSLVVLGLSFGATAAKAQYFPNPIYSPIFVGGYPAGYGSIYTYGYPYYWGNYPVVAGYGYPYYGYSYPSYGYPTYTPPYAAISYSPSTKKYGTTWGMDSRQSAIASAESFCNAQDCRSVVWVQGGCAALVSGNKSTQVFWAYHTYGEMAQDLALSACSYSGAKDCAVTAWTCSGS